MISKQLITKLTMIAGLALMATNASAIDGKNYAGIVCRQTSGGAVGFFGGTVSNASTASELNLLCPFVKDSTSVTSGTVTVYDRNPSIDVSCSIITEFNNASGNFFNFASVTSSGFGSAPQVLGFGAIPGNEYYYASCSVPRISAGNFSHVASFVVNEP